MIQKILSAMGERFARMLNKPLSHYSVTSVISPEQLQSVLRPGDVLLVEGNLRISSVIKYLTQSTWSHAAIYVGKDCGAIGPDHANVLVEADVEKGVIAVPLSKYCSLNTRICRPVRMTDEDRQKVVDYASSRLGYSYDLKNVFDLARYLFPTPPVPQRFRRRLLTFGSSEPTRAICSTLIAQAFQSVRYPILPMIIRGANNSHNENDKFHIRHHSLFVPRDFDLSPFFEIIKPTLDQNFNYKTLVWDEIIEVQ